MVNGSGKTASLKKSLKEIDITLMSTASVKSVSSSVFSFKSKSSWWVATPKKEVSFKPGGKLTVTVNVNTNGKTKYFGYKKAFFNWK